MIDNNAVQYSNYQLDLINNLLTKLDNLNYLQTVTILVNAFKGFESEIMSTVGGDMQVPIHLMAYNTSSVQKATCRLAWYTYSEYRHTHSTHTISL